MRNLAQRAASRVLNDDSQKAAVNSADSNLRAAHTALQHRRLPSALMFALKAAEKKHADANDLVGTLLLEQGLLTAAETFFGAQGSALTLRSASGRAVALAALHRPAADVSAACAQARKLLTAPEKQRLEAARLHAVTGAPDEALEEAIASMQGASGPGIGMRMRMHMEEAVASMQGLQPGRP